MPLLHSNIWLLPAFLLLCVVSSQSVGFTQYPNQVVTGQTYSVSWEAGEASVTVNFLQNGQQQQTLYSGTSNSLSWTLEDDDDAGTSYSLQLVVSGAAATTITSGPIWVIEDEDGLQVSGQVITASIANGPASSGLASAAAVSSTALSTSSGPTTSRSNDPSAAAASTRIETATFTTGNSIYTFTTTVSATLSHGTGSATAVTDSLTFVSARATFTTTIAATPTSTMSGGTPKNAPGADSLSGGAITGIIMAILVVLVAIFGCIWFRRRSAQKRKLLGGDGAESPVTAFMNGGRRALHDRKATSTDGKIIAFGGNNEKSEVRDSLIPPDSTYHEMYGSAVRSPVSTPNEVAGVERHEMNAQRPRYELEGGDVARIRSNQYPATCVSVSRAGTMNVGGTSNNSSERS